MGYSDLIDDVAIGWTRDFRHRKSGVNITKEVFDSWRCSILKDIELDNIILIHDNSDYRLDLINLLRLKYQLWLDIYAEKIEVSRDFPTSFILVNTVNKQNHWYTPKQFEKGTVMYYSGNGGHGSCNWLNGIPLWEDMKTVEGTSLIPSLQINYEFIEVFKT
jgi:hypothetical protein